MLFEYLPETETSERKRHVKKTDGVKSGCIDHAFKGRIIVVDFMVWIRRKAFYSRNAHNKAPPRPKHPENFKDRRGRLEQVFQDIV